MSWLALPNKVFFSMRFIGTPLFAILALTISILPPLARGQDAEKPKTRLPAIKPADYESLKNNIGKKVRIKGTVTSVGESPDGKVRFFNFGAGETGGFSALIVPDVFAKFNRLDDFVGKRVRVRGTLEMDGNNPFIKVTRPKQIKILESKGRRKKRAE